MDDRRFLLNYNAREKFYHRYVCVQVKCENQMKKIFFFIKFPTLACRSEVIGTQVIAQSLKTRQQNGPKLEILQTAINTCMIINILSLWPIWKKNKNPS